MKADIGTRLACPAGTAWREVRTSALLCHIMRPMLMIAPVDPPALSARWEAGHTYRFRAYAFGVVPLGIHELYFESIDEHAGRIMTRERNGVVCKWDHLISVAPQDERTCRYRDEIEIDAGPLTFIVWLWANWFYRYRQRRWRALAPSL